MYRHAIVRENGEVLLSAGTIGSPQLLLLSGIGPRPYLSGDSRGISSSVGQYLYEREWYLDCTPNAAGAFIDTGGWHN